MTVTGTREPTRTASDLLKDVSSRLGSATEARWIVETATGWDGGHLHSPSELLRPLPTSVVAGIENMVERRLGGEPLQYVLGTWSFRRLEVRVDPRVLVPRPETEQVVEFALDMLSDLLGEESSGKGDRTVVADLGTGSGVIALSMALEASCSADRPLEVWATDSSEDALDVARTNRDLLARSRPDAAARVKVARGSWFDALPRRLAGEVHLVVSNPPYVSLSEWKDLDSVVRDHEPPLALVAGETGVEVLELILTLAPRWLAPRGALVLELSPAQAEPMAERAASVGLVDVKVLPDLSGRPRALTARRGVD